MKISSLSFILFGEKIILNNKQVILVFVLALFLSFLRQGLLWPRLGFNFNVAKDDSELLIFLETPPRC